VFTVVAIHPEDMKESKLLELATYAECFSNHPIARSLADAYGKHIDKARVKNFQELQGQGVKAEVNGVKLCCGSLKFMESLGIDAVECHIPGSTVHVSVDGTYAGHIVISDQLKDDAEEALKTLKSLGVSKTVMITGDKKAIAEAVGKDLPSLDDCHYETLPEDKVNITKEIMESLDDVSKAPSSKKKTLAFVGDGINDAPVLTVADVGVAMGGMGSAAAVEAADVVLMNDRPSDVAVAIRIARKTMKIVKENIAFSLGVKVLVLILAAFGLSTMWMAEFADVGVCLLAILNSMRALKA
jgi:Cd2+/Zn2+-exporting ATPase